MGDHLKDFGLIDRQGWIALALCVGGIVPVVIAGVVGNGKIAVVVLACIAIAWAVLQQITRGILRRTLELAQESSQGWHTERDFVQELIDTHVATLEDLQKYNTQLAGVHLGRLRTILVKRNPELDDSIPEVMHIVNMPGMVI